MAWKIRKQAHPRDRGRRPDGGGIFCCAAAGYAQSPANPVPGCKPATEALTTATPLPNVTAALQQRKTLRILALGASPAAGRGIGRGGYTLDDREAP